jgi:hypothetical protein
MKMTKKQKLQSLQVLLKDFSSYMNEYEKRSYNFTLNHKFSIPQVSDSTYLLAFHYDNGNEYQDNQFLSFQDPMIAKAYIQALFNLMTTNDAIFHESTFRNIVITLLRNKSYL